MEHFDEKKAERVWQRIRGQEEPPRQTSLKALLLTAGENLAVYRDLARQMTGAEGRRLHILHRQLEQDIAALRGISRLRGEQLKLPKAAPSKLHPRRKLEDAWRRENELRREFLSRTSDPDHGGVFAALAHRAEERCLLLTRILGKYGSK